MAAGMEVVVAVLHSLQPVQIVSQRLPGKLPHRFLGGTGIDGIGGVGHNGAEAVFPAQGITGSHVGRVPVLGLAAPRISRKKLIRIGVNGQRRFSHGCKALGRRQVTSYIQHKITSQFLLIIP